MHIVVQGRSEFETQQTALVPVPPFPVPHVAEQKIVMNLKLTIMHLETLGITIPSQSDPDLTWRGEAR